MSVWTEEPWAASRQERDAAPSRTGCAKDAFAALPTKRTTGRTRPSYPFSVNVIGSTPGDRSQPHRGSLRDALDGEDHSEGGERAADVIAPPREAQVDTPLGGVRPLAQHQ